MKATEDNPIGILPLYPQGTNSTMFTEFGWDAESNHKRGIIRWRYAYRR